MSINTLIPLIRKIVPNIIANDITGVQPMSITPGIETGESHYPGGKIEFYWVKMPGENFFSFKSKPKREITPWQWCVNFFGPPQDPGSQMVTVWMAEGSKFYFRKEEDRTSFLLVWTR